MVARGSGRSKGLRFFFEQCRVLKGVYQGDDMVRVVGKLIGEPTEV